MADAPHWLVERPYAHRGLHDVDTGIPENSLSSFEAAIAQGYGIELDLQLAADDEAMVFHDDDLDRVTELSGPVEARPSAKLQQICLLGTNERIPTLKDALRMIGGRAPVLIEIKDWREPLGTLETAVLKDLATYRGNVAVQSFNPQCVNWFHRHRPDLPRGQISGRFRLRRHGRNSWQLFLMRNLLHAYRGRPHYIAYDIDGLPHPAPALARRLGVPVLAWTVKTETQLERAEALADNVIFEQIRP